MRSIGKHGRIHGPCAASRATEAVRRRPPCRVPVLSAAVH